MISTYKKQHSRLSINKGGGKLSQKSKSDIKSAKINIKIIICTSHCFVSQNQYALKRPRRGLFQVKVFQVL